MAKGKRPQQSQSSPWGRWAVVLVGLVLAGAIVWWVTRPTPKESTDQTAQTEQGGGPTPLGEVSGAGGPTVTAAASIENVPADSLVSAGPDAPQGVNITNDPRHGDPNAPVTIVEFSDFECPFCGRFHRETYPALQRLYGDKVRWIFVNHPIPGHQYAETAAIAGECAERQGSGKFWAFADYVFGHQEQLNDEFLRTDVPKALGLDESAYLECLNNKETASEVKSDEAEGARVGVKGTPTFFINGHEVEGAQPLGVFNDVISPYFSR